MNGQRWRARSPEASKEAVASRRSRWRCRSRGHRGRCRCCIQGTPMPPLGEARPPLQDRAVPVRWKRRMRPPSNIAKGMVPRVSIVISPRSRLAIPTACIRPEYTRLPHHTHTTGHAYRSRSGHIIHAHTHRTLLRLAILNGPAIGRVSFNITKVNWANVTHTTCTCNAHVHACVCTCTTCNMYTVMYS